MVLFMKQFISCLVLTSSEARSSLSMCLDSCPASLVSICSLTGDMSVELKSKSLWSEGLSSSSTQLEIRPCFLRICTQFCYYSCRTWVQWKKLTSCTQEHIQVQLGETEGRCSGSTCYQVHLRLLYMQMGASA